MQESGKGAQGRIVTVNPAGGIQHNDRGPPAKSWCQLWLLRGCCLPPGHFGGVIWSLPFLVTQLKNKTIIKRGETIKRGEKINFTRLSPNVLVIIANKAAVKSSP